MDTADKVLDKLAKGLSKKYSGSVAGYTTERPATRFVSTGSVGVDWVIGRLGIPLGRVVEVSGLPESGKSMLCNHALASFQQSGGLGILVDSEQAYTQEWAERMGVDWDKLIYFEPSTLEETFDFIDKDILGNIGDSEVPVLVVIDSFSALPTKKELDGDFEGRPMSEHARIASFALRKLTKKLADKNVTLMFVGQLKSSPSQSWGLEDDILGGRAVKFHACLRLRLKKIKSLKKKEDNIGMIVKVKSLKNKTGGAPHRELDIPFMWDRGIDDTASLLEIGKRLDVVQESSRGWYAVDGREAKFRPSDFEGVLEDMPHIKSQIIKQSFPLDEEEHMN